MAVTVARDTIVCPGCGGQRIVTFRQRRRSAQQGGIRCTSCRGLSSTHRHSEADLRFWLSRYGAPCPPDVPVRQFIVAGGAPPELVELALAVFPPR